MQISLRSTVRMLLFGCCVFLAVGEYVYLSSRAARAHAWAEGLQLQQIERAVALEPRNADYWNRLGRWHLLIDQDSVAALNSYREAVRQNPYLADSYLEIARLSLIANDHNQLTRALENALRVDPTTPSVNWEAGNLYLAVNDLDRALPLLRTASASSWEYRSPALKLCWRATHDVDQMVAVAIPKDPIIYGDFLCYLVSQNEIAPSDKLWSHLVGLKRVPTKAAFVYLDSLLAQHRVSHAVRAWRELAAMNPDIESGIPHDGNLVFNPGFEREILNGGFDWRITPSDKVSVELAPAKDSHSGEHSLEISFSAVNTPGAGILQLIPVEPGATYSLSLFYRAEDIEGAHGISAVVSDAFTGKQLVSTDEVLGSTPWREANQVFSTGPSTDLVAFELKRPAGTLIRGKLFIGDVRVVKQ